MESEVQENPTPSEGASIQDRLERYLAAEEAPAQQSTPAEPEEEQEAEPAVEPADDAPEESNEPQITTAELAKYLGLDDDVFEPEGDDLYIRTKIDGQEGRAKFADLLRAYQTQAHIDNRSREVAEQQKAFQAQAEQYQQAVSQRMQQAEDVASIAYQALMNESQSINWAELAQNDPAEYIAKQHEFNARKGQIDQALAYIGHERQQAQQQTSAQYQQYLVTEAQRLPELIPEWKNPEVAKAEKAELATWGANAGLTAEELRTVSNSVHVQIMRKAMLYDKLQASKTAVENKVRTAPRLVKAGQPDTASRGEKTVRDLKSNIRKSGGKSGVIEYLLATGKA